MRCEQCGAEHISTKVLEVYQDDGMVGLPNVFIVNAAEQQVCQNCGAENGIYIPDMEGLEAAIAVTRISLPVKLNGDEIRFLRKAFGLRAKELAECLQVRDETISRWENSKEVMRPQYEKLFRLFVGYNLSEKAPGVDFKEDAIVRMNIPVLTEVSKQHPVMAFRRIRVLVKRRQGREAWEPKKLLAA
jgi:transcriptional regulator with XRE-family HTH domain